MLLCNEARMWSHSCLYLRNVMWNSIFSLCEIIHKTLNQGSKSDMYMTSKGENVNHYTCRASIIKDHNSLPEANIFWGLNLKVCFLWGIRSVVNNCKIGKLPTKNIMISLFKILDKLVSQYHPKYQYARSYRKLQ